MNPRRLALLSLILLAGCSGGGDPALVEPEPFDRRFELELAALQEYFRIPGMAVLVSRDGGTVFESYLGYADLENQLPVDSRTHFPVASVTKVPATTLLMQLADEGLLSLDDPIVKYFPDSDAPAGIRLKHIVSHTSQGTPGDEFLYSGRFGSSTSVIEQAAGREFAELFQERILDPAGMDDSFLFAGQEDVDRLGAQLAKPYYYRGETTPGIYEFGYSTAAGLVVTLGDMKKFDDALEAGLLVGDESRDAMFSPFVSGRGEALPYGYGAFVQEFLGQKIVWAYGRHDCFSSLYLKVPARGLTLVMLANNSLLSDPARLINGDVSYSLFALSFLKHFVLLELTEGQQEVFYRQVLLAQAVAASYLGTVDENESRRSRDLFATAFELFPDWETYADLTLMHGLTRQAVRGDPGPLAVPLEEIGARILERYPDNPYANQNLGMYHAELGDTERAAGYYRTIVEAGNYSPNWYTREARGFLGLE